MVYYIVKVAISALLIVAIAEISKRSSLVAAVLARWSRYWR
jgi:putative Ca2+/H+ antiporter (TMEM165/GDT1 family)